jgi:hypothetical protein
MDVKVVKNNRGFDCYMSLPSLLYQFNLAGMNLQICSAQVT